MIVLGACPQSPHAASNSGAAAAPDSYKLGPRSNFPFAPHSLN
jgi:hypothetical protein